jgi:hypothetical protein
MPLTLLTTLLSGILMLTAWVVIGNRLQSTKKSGTYQARLLQSFFLYMGIFFLIVFSPHTLLSVAPDHFPLAMAVAYVIGHIFLYIAFFYIGRLLFSMVPRLNNKEFILYIFSVIAIVGFTALNIITMIGGTRPEFDSELHVTILNAHPALGAVIGLYSMLTIIPASLLLIKNGFVNPTNRIRSFLLGTGLLILVVMGSLHDVSPNGHVFMLADIGTVTGTLLIAGGVMYHIEEKIAAPRRMAARAAA